MKRVSRILCKRSPEENRRANGKQAGRAKGVCAILCKRFAVICLGFCRS